MYENFKIARKVLELFKTVGVRFMHGPERNLREEKQKKKTLNYSTKKYQNS